MFMTHTHTHTLTLTLTLTHTQLAQSIFKPGKDLVMFMTVVSSSLAVPSGKELLAKYMDATRATCVEAVAEVKVGIEEAQEKARFLRVGSFTGRHRVHVMSKRLSAATMSE
jgi:hypothetical protein